MRIDPLRIDPSVIANDPAHIADAVFDHLIPAINAQADALKALEALQATRQERLRLAQASPSEASPSEGSSSEGSSSECSSSEGSSSDQPGALLTEAGLGEQTAAVLASAGYATPEAVAAAPADDLLAIDGIGDGRLSEIESVLG